MLRSAVTTRKSLALVGTDALSHTCIYCALATPFFIIFLRKSLRFGGRGILVINPGATNVPLDYMQWIGDWALLMTFDSWSTHCILSGMTLEATQFPKGQRVFGMKMFNVAFDFKTWSWNDGGKDPGHQGITTALLSSWTSLAHTSLRTNGAWWSIVVWHSMSTKAIWERFLAGEPLATTMQRLKFKHIC